MTILDSALRFPEFIGQLAQRPNSGGVRKGREKAMAANLVAETLRGGLFTRIVGKRLLFFQEVGSTMDEGGSARREGHGRGNGSGS